MANSAAKVLLIVAVVALLGGASAQTGVKGYFAAIAANPKHKMMVDVINKQPQYKILMQTTTMPLTVFAPTDAGFTAASKKYGISTAAAVGNNNLMKNVLTYHVVPKSYPKSALKSGMKLSTMKGGSNTLTISITKDNKMYVKGIGSQAQVVKADQFVLNPVTGAQMGVIHDIAGVLLPSKDIQALI